LVIWNVSLADLPNSWQNLTFARCSNCDILNFCHSETTTLHNGDLLSEYTACIQLLLVGAREEWTQHHLMTLHIRCSAWQRHYAANPQNYWLYYVHNVLIRYHSLYIYTGRHLRRNKNRTELILWHIDPLPNNRPVNRQQYKSFY
jgi:hypothetical protein